MVLQKRDYTFFFPFFSLTLCFTAFVMCCQHAPTSICIRQRLYLLGGLFVLLIYNFCLETLLFTRRVVLQFRACVDDASRPALILPFFLDSRITVLC